MTKRLTRQGIRQLDPIGHNGHRNGKKCRHHFVERVQVGTRWVADEYSFGEAYEEPVYGRKCLWCPAVRVER